MQVIFRDEDSDVEEVITIKDVALMSEDKLGAISIDIARGLIAFFKQKGILIPKSRQK